MAAARPSLAVRDGVAQGVYAQDRGHGFPELAAGERVGLPSGFNPAEGAALFRPCSLFHLSPHWLPLLTQRAVNEKCKTSYLAKAYSTECNMPVDQAGQDDVGKTFGVEE